MVVNSYLYLHYLFLQTFIMSTTNHFLLHRPKPGQHYNWCLNTCVCAVFKSLYYQSYLVTTSHNDSVLWDCYPTVLLLLDCSLPATLTLNNPLTHLVCVFSPFLSEIITNLLSGLQFPLSMVFFSLISLGLHFPSYPSLPSLPGYWTPTPINPHSSSVLITSCSIPVSCLRTTLGSEH